MTENILQLIAVCKLVWLTLFALCYGLGGMSNKWIRRYLGSAWLLWGIIGFAVWEGTFSWWFLLYYPLLVGALSLGYGAEELWDKIRRRFIYGAALGCAALPIAIVTGQWLLFGWHVALCLQASIILGVWNPIDARHEETSIATFSGILPLMMV